MATRARTSRNKTTGPVPPITTDEQSQAVSPPGADPVVQISDESLERRDIPSFSESREARIAEAAYWRAERRSFAPGYELEDWLAAEREIDEARQREHQRSDG